MRRGTQAPLIGPLFFYDLVRLARRGRGIVLRFLYVVFLFYTLWVLYRGYFPEYDLLGDPFAIGRPMPSNEMARFAESFVMSVLTVQGIAVLVLTPGYVATAIAEETEKRTLLLLFTTHLHNHEIVLGKLFARLLHLVSILLAGLPILSLLQLWGGVDVFVLLALFVVTGLTLLSIGSISILCSVYARSVLGAVISSYLVVGLITFCCGPAFFSSPVSFLFTLKWEMGQPATNFPFLSFIPAYTVLSATGAAPPDFYTTLARLVGIYALVHGVVIVICLSVAVVRVRRQALEQLMEPQGTEAGRLPSLAPSPARPLPPGGPHTVPARPLSSAPFRMRPPVSDAPLLWKEMDTGISFNDAATGCFMLPAIIIAFIVMGMFLTAILGLSTLSVEDAIGQVRRFVEEHLNSLIRLMSAVILSVWCLETALRAAGSFVRERQQQTLDTLLMLPVRRERIVGAKWLGSVLRVRSLGVCLLVIWGLGVVTGSLHPVAVLQLALLACVHIALLASLGVWISLIARNQLWAHLSMGLILLLFFLGSNFLQLYANALAGTDLARQEWLRLVFGLGLNPVRSWWYFGMSGGEFDETWASYSAWYNGPLGASLLGNVILGLLAELFWQAACLRLGREGR
jgi:ABC-type transport system involved in multi-copper enzyme maturation permease subunit